MGLTVLQSMSTFSVSAKAEAAKRAMTKTKTFILQQVFATGCVLSIRLSFITRSRALISRINHFLIKFYLLKVGY